MKILFTGGGSGGHLIPIIAIVRELRRLTEYESSGGAKQKPLAFYYIGPGDQTWIPLLTAENIKTYAIAAGKVRRYFAWQNITDILFKIPFGFLQSFFLMLFIRPNLVFSKGGTSSAIVVFSAWLLGIPVFLHESDTVPGQNNRFAARFAKKIFISFEKTSYFNLNKTMLVGNPIQKELLEGDNNLAKEIFNLASQKPVLLFLGGSQGAQPINDFLLNILATLLEKYEIIHVCGKKNEQEVRSEAQAMLSTDLQPYYHPYGLLDEIHLKHALKAASLIISRTGSASIFEIAACGKPSILVPLPSSAGGHQSKNAYEYAKTGAAIVVEQENLNPNFFMEKINYLFENPDQMQSMQKAALSFAKPLAAKAVAEKFSNFYNANDKKEN